MQPLYNLETAFKITGADVSQSSLPAYNAVAALPSASRSARTSSLINATTAATQMKLYITPAAGSPSFTYGQMITTNTNGHQAVVPAAAAALVPGGLLGAGAGQLGNLLYALSPDSNRENIDESARMSDLSYSTLRSASTDYATSNPITMPSST